MEVLSFVVLVCLLFLYYQNPVKCLIIVVVTYPTLCLFTVSRFPITLLIGCVLLLGHIYGYKETGIKRKLDHRLFSFSNIHKTPVSKDQLKRISKLKALKFAIINDYKHFFFIIPISLCIISYFISSIVTYSLHLSNVLAGVKSFLIIYLIWKMLPSDRKTVNFFIKTIIIYSSICIVYGLFEAIFGVSVFVDFLISNKVLTDAGGDNSYRTGFFRTRSFTIWCETYGTMLMSFIYTLGILTYRRYIKKTKFIIIWSLFALFAVYTTNSRTMMICTLLSLFGFYPIFKKNLSSFFLSGLVVVVLIIGTGFLRSKSVRTLVDPNKAEGSSIEMRENQLLGVYTVTQGYLLWGRGLGAQTEVLEMYDGLFELNGLESIVFTTLVQRGLFGLLTVFLLWLYCFRYIYISKQYYLLFYLLAYVLSKIMTLTPHLEEDYVIFFLIPLFRFIPFPAIKRNGVSRSISSV